MENRPEFLGTWMGLAKLGVTVALLNTHARGRAFEHALATAAPKLVIAGSECLEAIESLDAAAQRRFAALRDERDRRAGAAQRRDRRLGRAARARADRESRPRGARRSQRRRRSLLHLHLGHDGTAEGRAALAHALARRRRRHVGGRGLRARRRDRLRAAALPRRGRHGGDLERARAGRGGAGSRVASRRRASGTTRAATA